MTTSDLPSHDSTAPRSPRLHAGGIPLALAAAVEDFKAAMLAANRLVIKGSATEAEIQDQVSRACSAVADALRARVHSDAAGADSAGAFVFRETYPYFALSTLIDRSYVKPRGYAGDYLTLEMVYDDRPAGVHRLGRYIDQWFLGIPASRAVKNRRGLLRDIIFDVARSNGGRRSKITSLACGPAREVFDVLAEPGHPDIDATCVDVDNEALAYAQGIARRTGVWNHVSFVQANVVKLALGRETLELRDQDLVYSIGLIDYLRDHLVVRLLDWIYDRLRPGGIAVVGNFDVDNPDKTFMDHVLDWKLFHRSAQDLTELFARSKFDAVPVDVRFEDTCINLFALARRPG
ncbi:MAG: class I SAM-dependent methyltransferase [Mycobacterium sp.]